MKLLFFLILAACMQVSAIGHSQQITLTQKDATLEQVFSEIKKQSGYTFFYADNLLSNAKKVTISTRDASIEEVLDIVFRDQPLTYTIIDKDDKFVVIKSKAPEPGHPELVSGSFPQPPIDIKGRIVNENNEPLEGVTVKIKGTDIGTSTNANGEFILNNVDETATLLFSGVNIETFERKLSPSGGGGYKSGEVLTLNAKTKITSLNEVVINKGYYTEKQKYSVSNVGIVTAKDIQKQPVNNPLLALQGRVTGVTIEQATGVPGTAIKIRIQGENSLASGNEPLYIIDGVPFPQYMASSFSAIQGAGVSSPLTYINPGDIESIEILKDADATAIYGSRASNGVVLITTKKGNAGQTKVELNLQQGWSKVGHFLKLMNTQQYLEMRNEALSNDGITAGSTDYDVNGTWDKHRYTDWQKKLIGGTAKFTDAQLAISGGTTATNFMIRGGYNRVTTVFPGDLSDQKASLLFNIKHASANQQFRISLSGNYLSDKNQLIAADLTTMAITMPPNAPALYSDDGSLNWAPVGGNSTWLNPLAFTKQRFKQQINSLTANAVLSYQLLPGLILKSSVGYNNIDRDELNLVPLEYNAPEFRPFSLRTSRFGKAGNSSWIIEPQLSYQTKIKKGKLDFLLGTTFLQTKTSQQNIFAYGFSTDQLMEDILSATTVLPLTSSGSENRYSAIFGRFNYNWKNKLIVNLTARRDGSSRFGSENQMHNFGAIGGAWVFSEEKFIQNWFHFLSFGKLRMSYGTTGNDQIGDYKYLNTYFSPSRPVPYQNQPGLTISGISNPYLQWEETRKFQGGLDLGFWNNRILLNTGFYLNRSSNQLQAFALPIITGVNNITINFPATVQNSGWEFALSSRNIEYKDFSWSSSVNLTLPKNKLVKYENLEKSSAANRYVIGQPVSLLKSFPYIGVDPASGLFIFRDKQGGITSNPAYPDDATIFSNSVQPFYGGLQNSIQYRGFTFDFLFQFVKQKGWDYRFGNMPGFFYSDGSGSLGNQPINVMDRWQKPGDHAFFQQFSATYPFNVGNPYYQLSSSTALVNDASYIKLKNISLSWELPGRLKKNVHLQSCRFYLQAQNVFTITNYIGLDPESGYSSLPPLRTITAGVQVSF